MGYFIANNANDYSKFHLTNTCNKPRIAVRNGTSTSYIPMRTALTTVTTTENFGHCVNQMELNHYTEDWDWIKDFTTTKIVRNDTHVYRSYINFDYDYGYDSLNLDYKNVVDSDKYTDVLYSNTILDLKHFITTPYNGIYRETMQNINYANNILNYWSRAYHLSRRFTFYDDDLRFNLNDTDNLISITESTYQKINAITAANGTFYSVFSRYPSWFQANAYINKFLTTITFTKKINSQIIILTQSGTKSAIITNPVIALNITQNLRRTYLANKNNPIEVNRYKNTCINYAPGCYNVGGGLSEYGNAYVYPEIIDEFKKTITITVQTWI